MRAPGVAGGGRSGAGVVATCAPNSVTATRQTSTRSWRATSPANCPSQHPTPHFYSHRRTRHRPGGERLSSGQSNGARSWERYELANTVGDSFGRDNAAFYNIIKGKRGLKYKTSALVFIWYFSFLPSRCTSEFMSGAFCIYLSLQLTPLFNFVPTVFVITFENIFGIKRCTASWFDTVCVLLYHVSYIKVVNTHSQYYSAGVAPTCVCALCDRCAPACVCAPV